MAFNFNWSPLTADADFYSRARDLLTKALNKNEKPPIIVDDILVSELNLGTVPPDLEILEIGDLAEDRFRGIFKMCYSGDAFLTLKTRVQANPLNTYLYSKPSFTSPQPLAAASGLTIPLSITLSEIRLSAFIILVFSKQKGLTLVFRNDPLESLKVSSTFDSIQFVRDYLQRTIEQQLRTLMMEELPAIIHRLSLQLWCPDQAPKTDDMPTEEPADHYVDPFASPPADPVDCNGHLLDPNAMAEVSLNGGGEVQSLFSQKNLLKLSALTDSHRTLSLFTPSIKDVVFRAWSGAAERTDCQTPTNSAPGLTRTVSFPMGNSTTYTFSDTGSASGGHLPSRPSQISLHSAMGGAAFGSRSRPGRKKKTRVVNLRRSKSEATTPDTTTECGSDAASVDVPFSEPTHVDSIPEESPLEMPRVHASPVTNRPHLQTVEKIPATLDQQLTDPAIATQGTAVRSGSDKDRKFDTVPLTYKPSAEKSVVDSRSKVALGEPSSSSDSSSVILEQAWIMKMAGEIAQRVYDEKRDRQVAWDDRDDVPPPAYEATV